MESNNIEKEEVIEGILYFLQGTAPTFDRLGYTYLQIRDFLKLNNVKSYSEDEKSSLQKLKQLLRDMEEKGLIEERHFEEKYGGRVDYNLEQKGIDLLQKRWKEEKAKDIKLENKWKLPD